MRRGFTLIELLVVIAIIGVLSSVVLASLNSARNRAADARRASDLTQIRSALELYATANNGRYPATSGWRSQCSTWGGLAADQVIPGLVPTYLPQMPSDPNMNASANSCCYLYSSDTNDYKLLIAHSCSAANYQSQRSLLDPARDGGSQATVVETGLGAWSWATFTPNAIAW